MKKNVKIYVVAIVAMAAVGCMKENNPDGNKTNSPNLTEYTISAEAEAGEASKSGFGEDYPIIEWNENDLISVIGASTQNQQFKATSAGVSTEFNGLLDLSDETLYAVYPYDAVITAGTTAELLDVTVPSVQYATANSFDPKAYVAVAKSTTKSFAFKAVGGFFKFRLEDAADVKSVTIVTNGDNVNIAGTAGVTFNEDGIPSHGVSGTWKSSTNTIKLVEAEGGHQFSENTDYFIATRANSCPNGVTFYIEYDNGDVYTKSTTKKIFSDGSRNKIAYMGVFGKSNFTLANDLYTLYNMGYDIKVGDIIINKGTYDNATLVSENYELTATNSSKVYFIDKDADFTFSSESGMHDLIIIGNDPTNKSDFILNKSIRLNQGANEEDGILVLANLKINGSTPSYGMQVYANGKFGYVGLKNCDIAMGGKSLYYLQHNDRAIREFYMEGCNYEITSETQRVLQIGTSTSTYGKVTFKNNIFYCASDTGVGRFYLLHGASSTLEEIHMIQNTFAGVYNNMQGTNHGYVDVASLNKVYITNNLFYLPLFDTKAYANTKYTAIIKCSTLPVAGKVEKNVILKPAESPESIDIRPLKYSGTDFSTDIAPANSASTENKYSNVINTATLNLANGVIESVHSQYGATR